MWIMDLRYLEAIIGQESAWFDTQDVQSLSNDVQWQCKAIEDAASEKLATLFGALGAGIGMLVTASLLGWKLALVGLTTVPPLLLSMHMLTQAIQNAHAKNEKNFKASSRLASQAISGIWVVAGFG